MQLKPSIGQAKPSFSQQYLERNSKRPYRLTQVERPKYVHALVQFETISRESARFCLGEIAHRCAHFGTKRLVLERDIRLMMPLPDIFFESEDFVRSIDGIRVAFVNPYAGLDDQLDVIVLMASMRGAAFSVHRTLADAEKWLVQDIARSN